MSNREQYITGILFMTLQLKYENDLRTTNKIYPTSSEYFLVKNFIRNQPWPTYS